MEKKGKVDLLSVLIASTIVFVVYSVFVVALTVDIRTPGNHSINASRMINITFNATWSGSAADPNPHENVSNCSLWINSTTAVIQWAIAKNITMVLNRSAEQASDQIHNTTSANGPFSYMNYTFSEDGNYTFAVACYSNNGSTGTPTLNSSGNFSVFIDFSAPAFNFTSPQNLSFNTSSITTTKINFTINDSGLGLNLTANGSINLSLYLGGTRLNRSAYMNASHETNLTCTPTSATELSRGIFTCNATYTFNSNGTYVLNATATDALGTFGFSTITFTVDQIPPVLLFFNVTANTTNESRHEQALGSPNLASVPSSGAGTWAQGRTFKAFANFTENLTTGLEVTWQFYNATALSWQTINTTNDDGADTVNITKYTLTGTNSTFIATFNFTPPTGYNEFEGRNISFRVIANDSLGNINTSLYTRNITIQINDTTKPIVTINGTLGVNGTNISTARPRISWTVVEGRPLTSINISMDKGSAVEVIPDGTGIGDGCSKSAFYTFTATGDNNVETGDITGGNRGWRNGSFQISDGNCPLLNGTHNVTVTAIDSWGNKEVVFHNFNVQNGTIPGLQFSLTNEDVAGTWGKGAVNNTNITSRVGINLTGTNSVGATSIDKVSYFSSCDSAVRVENNATIIYPFNASGCNSTAGNRTLTVTINDTAGNSNTTVFTFMVDNVAPTITVHNPASGFTTADKIEVNVSAFDGESQIQWIKYYLDGGFTLLNHTQNGSVLTGGFGQNTTSIINRTINFTAGTHRIKISVNDTLGNIRNSSEITFTYNRPFNFTTVNESLYVYYFNYSNVSVFNSSGNLISDSSTPRDVNQTLELFMALNSSGANINVSINFNGSAANWDAINFSVKHNNSKMIAAIQNNFTVQVVELVSFNTSSDGSKNNIDEFLSDNNSYYGFMDLALNATNVSSMQTDENRSKLGEKFELWYFSDETTLYSHVNITECAQGKVITHKTTSDSNFPCWNNTLNTTVRVYVPHFSAIALVNNTRPPTVTVNFPKDTQTESSFFANITVSNDAVLCNVSYVGANANITRPDTNVTMDGPTQFGDAKVCTKHLNVTNSTVENINITFNVFDSNDNLNTTVFNFNVSDTTVHNISSITIGSITTTGATVTVNANESVNMSVNSTGSNVLAAGHYTNQSNLGKTNSITFSSLASSTKYNFTVQTCDKAGNCIFNWTLGFTTDEAAATTTAAAAAAASGGGGGGGAAAVSAVTDSKAQIWQSVPAGSSVSLDVDKSAIAVTSVAVNDVKSDLKGVELEVAALSENPVTTEAAAKVYQYFRINKKNLADADAESFKITFRVTKAWLSENGLASADVALYRFAGDKWNELATTVASTDAAYVNYESDTPGFSSFAVGVKSGVKVEEAPAGEEAGEVPGEEAAPPEAVEAPKPVEAPGKAPVAWIIAAVVIILGIVLIVAYQKQKKKA